MAKTSAAIIARLKQGPATIDDLRPHCNSRRAVAMMIYRLREQGYRIDSTPPKSAGGQHVYTLKRIPGSLAPWRFPPVGVRLRPGDTGQTPR